MAILTLSPPPPRLCIIYCPVSSSKWWFGPHPYIFWPSALCVSLVVRWIGRPRCIRVNPVLVEPFNEPCFPEAAVIFVMPCSIFVCDEQAEVPGRFRAMIPYPEAPALGIPYFLPHVATLVIRLLPQFLQDAILAPFLLAPLLPARQRGGVGRAQMSSGSLEA